jgi:Domain of unknown function (DUF4190)
MTDPFAIHPPPAPAPERSVQIAPFNSAHYDRLCRVGLWLGVLSGLLCVVAGFGDRVIAEQLASTVMLDGAAFVVTGAIMAALIGTAVLLPYAWARITGIGLLAVAGFIYGLLIIIGRSDETLFVGPQITLGAGGILLLLAFLAATIGLTFALVGAPRIGRPSERTTSGEEIKSQSGYAVTSLVLSLCGLITGVTAPLGIAFAVAALDDDKRSNGHRTGRGMAIAGLVVGIVVVAFSVLVMAGMIGTVDPSINES